MRPRRLRSIILLAKTCNRLVQYVHTHSEGIQNAIEVVNRCRRSISKVTNPYGQRNRTLDRLKSSTDCGTDKKEDLSTSFLLLSSEKDPVSEISDKIDWIDREKQLDESKIWQRVYGPEARKLQAWIWELWCR